MNYKLLFPTYRNRYLFVRNQLRAYQPADGFPRVLNLGTGEGDYDPMILPAAQELVSCDINERDIQFARQLNAGLEHLEYRVENALDLSFPDNSFDLVISVDVLEHVGQPEQMVAEVSRILKPGGRAFITFPNLEFPWTYDPINRVLGLFTKRKIPQGAYAFGHAYLVSGQQFRGWAAKYGLGIVEERKLSQHLVALLEMYWTGIIQRLFKDNAGNIAEDVDAKKVRLRPSTQAPKLVAVTDTLIGLDRLLFGWSKRAVGKGFVVQKKS
ncbi:MAG: methyltransferase domain-containing protein [Phaeodactylibacter sp.]|nr:methyltransferase domain-containing protein [Phaeodactylibacter sp.]